MLLMFFFRRETDVDGEEGFKTLEILIATKFLIIKIKV